MKYLRSFTNDDVMSKLSKYEELVKNTGLPTHKRLFPRERGYYKMCNEQYWMNMNKYKQITYFISEYYDPVWFFLLQSRKT